MRHESKSYWLLRHRRSEAIRRGSLIGFTLARNYEAMLSRETAAHSRNSLASVFGPRGCYAPDR